MASRVHVVVKGVAGASRPGNHAAPAHPPQSFAGHQHRSLPAKMAGTGGGDGEAVAPRKEVTAAAGGRLSLGGKGQAERALPVLTRFFFHVWEGGPCGC